jgi:hypothetical protein
MKTTITTVLALTIFAIATSTGASAKERDLEGWVEETVIIDFTTYDSETDTYEITTVGRQLASHVGFTEFSGSGTISGDFLFVDMQGVNIAPNGDELGWHFIDGMSTWGEGTGRFSGYTAEITSFETLEETFDFETMPGSLIITRISRLSGSISY